MQHLSKYISVSCIDSVDFTPLHCQSSLSFVRCPSISLSTSPANIVHMLNCQEISRVIRLSASMFVVWCSLYCYWGATCLRCHSVEVEQRGVVLTAPTEAWQQTRSHPPTSVSDTPCSSNRSLILIASHRDTRSIAWYLWEMQQV